MGTKLKLYLSLIGFIKYRREAQRTRGRGLNIPHLGLPDPARKRKVVQ